MSSRLRLSAKTQKRSKEEQERENDLANRPTPVRRTKEREWQEKSREGKDTLTKKEERRKSLYWSAMVLFSNGNKSPFVSWSVRIQGAPCSAWYTAFLPASTLKVDTGPKWQWQSWEAGSWLELTTHWNLYWLWYHFPSFLMHDRNLVIYSALIKIATDRYLQERNSHCL